MCKKDLPFIRYVGILLAVVMLFTVVNTNVFAFSTSDSGGVTTMDFDIVPQYNVQLDTEDVIIKSEGSTFKIQMSTVSKNSYSIQDIAETTDKYGNVKPRQVVVQRNVGATVFSPTITITVPTSAKDQNCFVSTISGNIRMENTHNKVCTLQSENGNVYVANSYAKFLQTTSKQGNIDVINNTTENYINAQSDTGIVTVQCANTNNEYTVKVATEPNANISINGQRYDGGNYTIGPNEPLRYILLGGKSNTFKLSNVVLRGTKVASVASTNTTKDEKLGGTDFFFQRNSTLFSQLV